MPIFQAELNGRTVDTDSPDFQEKVEWIRKNLSLRITPSLVIPYTNTNTNDKTVLTAAFIRWVHQGKESEQDVFWLDSTPTAALHSIATALGISATTSETWQQYEDRRRDERESPVGDSFGGNSLWFLFRAGVDQEKWPEGAEYIGIRGGVRTRYRRQKIGFPNFIDGWSIVDDSKP